MIAALYVDPNGCYSEIEGVDCRGKECKVTNLKEIKERWAKATPGPWISAGYMGCAGTRYRVKAKDTGDAVGTIESRHSAEAIASAPEDIARLVAEVEKLRAERSALGQQLPEADYLCTGVEERAEKAEADVERLSLLIAKRDVQVGQ